MTPCNGFAASLVALALVGCGTGHSLIKDADLKPLDAAPGLAESSDARIAATIDAVIVRNGKGAWASDADWDEYLVRVRSLTDEPVTLKDVAVYDAIDQRRASLADRGELVRATRDVETRYGQSGQLVKTEGVGWTIVAGAGMVGAGVVAGAASVVGSYMAAMGGAAAGTGVAVAAAASSVLILGGGVAIGAAVVRAVNNSRVNDEIQRRHTGLPVALAARGEARLNAFFPLVPLPRRLEIVYADARGDHVLHVDTRVAMAEHHREATFIDPLIHASEPRFPKDAVKAGIEKGFVKARLSVDAGGKPQRIELLETSHAGYFDDEALRTFRRYRYMMSEEEVRNYDVRLEFRR